MRSATSLSTAIVFIIGLIVGGWHCVFISSTYPKLLADFSSSLGTSSHYKQEARSNITIDANSPYADNLKSEYVPASSETYLIQNMKKLNLDGDDHKKVYSYRGCAVWKDKTVAPEIYDVLTEYRKEIIAYHQKIGAMKPIPSIMESIRKHDNHAVCDAMRLHPAGIPGFFPSKQLSSHGKAGYAEPLLTPMRHPSFCFDRKKHLMDMKYMVMDFERMCRDLKPYSRAVLIDMGASLTFHHTNEDTQPLPPIMYLLNEFKRFGFRFDHIYGIEITFQEPSKVFNELLPTEYIDSYHWINTGVSAEKGHKMNPLDSILRKFTKEDLVIVKLDIDTPSVEISLAHQLLEDNSLHELVDHLFFEHHVLMAEIEPNWRGTSQGSVKSSFDLFEGLRKKGVMSHFWV